MSDDLERAKAFFLSDNGAGAAYEGGNTGRYYEALVALLAAARADERAKVLEEAARECEKDADTTQAVLETLPGTSDRLRADREGQFIGAARCADAIRSLATKDGAK